MIRAMWLWFGVAALVLLAPAARAAEPGGAKSIYSCVLPSGEKIVRDRPIAECMDREQRTLNKDGSPRGSLKPPPTADEQARMDAELQTLRRERASQDEAAKYDRLLKVRYPDDAAHERKRYAELERLRSAVSTSERRLKGLDEERAKLRDEREFYKGRKMPDKLKQLIDANNAATSAQQQLMKQQHEQIDDINRIFDAELERLRKLWAGARPGTIGPVPGGRSAAP